MPSARSLPFTAAMRMIHGFIDTPRLCGRLPSHRDRPALPIRHVLVIDVANLPNEMASRVQVHREFMSTTMQRAMDAGNRGRSLADYVSNEKMHQVADSCRRTHGRPVSPFGYAHMFHVRTGNCKNASTRLRRG